MSPGTPTAAPRAPGRSEVLLWLIFGEQVSLLRAIGIAAIVIGVALIATGDTSSSSHP